MDRNLVFFILSLVAVWLLMDDFVGKNRISLMVDKITGKVSPPTGDPTEKTTPKPPTSGDPKPISPSLAVYPTLPSTPKTGGTQPQVRFV